VSHHPKYVSRYADAVTSATGAPRAPAPDRGADIRSHLPAEPNIFVGREQELDELRKLVCATRMVTLTGPGGIGKTRLALRALGLAADEFPDGARYVELAEITSPDLVVARVASVVGVAEEKGRPLLDTLADALRPRTMVLALDNCEHLLEACARLCQRLLAAAPDLRLLATSREPLRVAGETVWQVPPRAVTSADGSRSEAVRLFAERAAAIAPGFALTPANATAAAAICRSLDGIPLAIELAAVRVRMLKVKEIAARLSDRFGLLRGGSRTALPRHQTLEGLIDWSYALLSGPERALLQRLAVFAGGWTLEAAEAVGYVKKETGTRANASQPGVLELLEQLASKSLVVVDREPAAQPRYRLLETIRQYALARLEASGEAEAARQRHAAYFLTLFEVVPYDAYFDWAKDIMLEYDNVRAALAWAESTPGQTLLSLQLAQGLSHYWNDQGNWSEGRLWSARALALPGVEDHPDLQANLFEFLGNCCASQGDYAAGEQHLTHSLSLFRALENRTRTVLVLEELGWLAREQGDAVTARERLVETVALARQTGDKIMIGEALVTLAGVAIMQEDSVWATTLLEEALVANQEARHLINTGWSLNHLGQVAQLQGQYERAWQLHNEGLRLFELLGPRFLGVAWANRDLGETALAERDVAAARTHLSLAIESLHDSGDRACTSWCLAGLAGVAVLEVEPRRAAQLWGAAEALRQLIGARHAPASRATRERLMAEAREQLGEQAFAAAWAEGQVLTPEQAIALALSP
jgi:predicted ATPase